MGKVSSAVEGGQKKVLVGNMIAVHSMYYETDKSIFKMDII